MPSIDPLLSLGTFVSYIYDSFAFQLEAHNKGLNTSGNVVAEPTSDAQQDATEVDPSRITLPIELQIMILKTTFRAVHVDDPRASWSGERPRDIALRWFLYRNLCLSKALHPTIIQELYRRIEMPFSSSRAKLAQAVQALQGASRMPESIEYLILHPPDLRGPVEVPNWTNWTSEMRELLPVILQRSKPRRLELYSSQTYPCPLLSQLNMRNVEHLDLRVTRRDMAALKVYGEIVMCLLPQLRSLRVRELALLVSSERTLAEFAPRQLERIDLPHRIHLDADDRGTRGEAAYIVSIADAYEELLKMCRPTLRYLDISGLQRRVQAVLKNYSPDLTQFPLLECLSITIQEDQEDVGAQMRSIEGIRRLRRLVLKPVSPAIREGSIKPFIGLFNRLREEEKLPPHLEEIDCSALTRQEEYMMPATDRIVSQRLEWRAAVAALVHPADSSDSPGTKLFLFGHERRSIWE